MIRVRTILLLGLIGLSFLAIQALKPDSIASAARADGSNRHEADAGRANYVGDGACDSCHKKQGLSYLHTSHHFTSQPPNKESVLGSFQQGSNVLAIVDPTTTAGPFLYFKMEAKNGHYYETAVTGWGTQEQTRTEPIDVVTGSGVRGATYLYWQGNQLFELPVSYWTDGHRWINSPGYEDGSADFSRPVNPGCLECHATYIRPLSQDPSTNRYDRDSLVTGISCERCHGPGAQHVARQKAGSGSASAGQAILNPANFSRDRQVDMCALCHNGIQREATAPAFSFEPGKRLSDYFHLLPTNSAEHPDVHGNQVGLLKRSRCYLSSPNMTCSTCHDVHAKERPAASYSAKCLTCHQWQSCGLSKTMGHSIANNCIDCHMPVEPTRVIVSETADHVVRATMRNHWIKIYPGTGKQ
ncbi:MAG TPA: multiheme c-type cytochrome [Acidobacteriaceae bacterium]|nr:multiheme c-type cytochrome [Acidobacteriaceae bacterium]